jgi:hypothetical protein
VYYIVIYFAGLPLLASSTCMLNTMGGREMNENFSVKFRKAPQHRPANQKLTVCTIAGHIFDNQGLVACNEDGWWSAFQTRFRYRRHVDRWLRTAAVRRCDLTELSGTYPKFASGCSHGALLPPQPPPAPLSIFSNYSALFCYVSSRLGVTWPHPSIFLCLSLGPSLCCRIPRVALMR